MVLVLSQRPTDKSEYPGYCRLRQRPKYLYLPPMAPALRRQMHIAVPSHEGSAEEVSAIECDNELGPACDVGGLEGGLEREVPCNFLAIGCSHLAGEILVSVEHEPVDAVHDGAEGSEGVVLLEDAGLYDSGEGDEECFLADHPGDEVKIFLHCLLLFLLGLADEFLALGVDPEGLFLPGQFVLHNI